MQQEIFKIGEVTLNFRHYSGMDLYSDGEVEDEILGIVRNHRPEEFPSIIEQERSWPIFYHLSRERSNIIEWIPMRGDERVLEVGSGCGAITGMLAAKAGEVTAVDLSRKRSEINAVRNNTCSNVTIHVGNFRDIEPDLPANYDFIFLIGVFEYAQGYIGTEQPYENFLRMLFRHLTPGGRIVIAIENRLGLKYFAGCVEDHLGTYFSGIQGYRPDSVATTFSRNGLIRILKSLGIQNYHFYYPYPDYKFMNLLFSDQYLPRASDLMDNVYNYDSDRLILFNEKRAYEGLIRDGLYPTFANSFELVIGPGFSTIFSKYSGDRAEEFRIRTDITIEPDGRRVIEKHPLTPAATEHVKSMRSAYTALANRFRGSDLEINDCQLDATGTVAKFSFAAGIPLSELLDYCLFKDDMVNFHRLFAEYLRRIRYGEEEAVADFDLIFPNILVNGPIWTVIDYEWTWGKRIPARDIAFRAIYCYRLEDKKRRVLDPKPFYEELDLTKEEVDRLIAEEASFQKYVTGDRLSLVEIWKGIGKRATVPRELEVETETLQERDPLTVQIYSDIGEGFSEDNSYFADEHYNRHHAITLEIDLLPGTRALRIDPAFVPCLVTLQRVAWNGVSVGERAPVVTIHPNGRWIGADSILFAKDDPGIEFGIAVAEREKKNRLTVTLTTALLPAEVAGSVEEGLNESEGFPLHETEEERGGLFAKLKRRGRNMQE
ncbi:MAG: class I SAM-dependent methyltransferase [Lachnospiraceae bacterium]|nr:class I SAM-dependent methyltransferase [Lachnospiraceae bacterium]